MWDLPTIGTVIELASDWQFDAWFERRNQCLFELMPALDQNKYPNRYCEIIHSGAIKTPVPSVLSRLNKGVQLKIERIFLKNGMSEFDSYTFRTLNFPPQKIQVLENEYVPIVPLPVRAGAVYKTHNIIQTIKTKNIKQLRFWAKLADVRNMDVKIIKL